MDFISEEIMAYCQKYSTPENTVLEELSRETQMKVLQPRMLSGHLQGQLLKMFSEMINPSTVLEIGTYTGYAAICLAHGLKDGGQLHTIELNPELEFYIKKYINKAGFDNKITLHIGNAAAIIPTLKHVYDLVFIDADKENYINYFELVFPKLRKGGFVVADNVLWSGKVLNPAHKDRETAAIAEFNKYIKERKDVEKLMLPFRDGLLIVKKT